MPSMLAGPRWTCTLTYSSGKFDILQYLLKYLVKTQRFNIFFRNKKTEEDGYILFIRQNAIQVLIPKFGLEGTLYIKNDSGFVFDEEVPSQTMGDVTLTLFQKLKVQLSLDQSNVQHEKLELKLIQPHIPGFSVEKSTDQGTDKSIGNIKSEVLKRPVDDQEQTDGLNKSAEKKTKWKKL